MRAAHFDFSKLREAPRRHAGKRPPESLELVAARERYAASRWALEDARAVYQEAKAKHAGAKAALIAARLKTTT
jgi:hypothetical protein